MIEVARLLLAVVFAVAGVAKLLDRDGSRKAARAFGVPAWLGIAVPVVEIGIAVTLVPATTARVAAVAAAALLAAFTLAIGNALLRGRKPDCGCLGRLHSAPASWRTIARNVGLAAVALAIVWQPAGSLSWVEVAVAAVAIALVAQAILSAVLLRRYGRALERIEALEVPPVVLPSSPAAERTDGSARVALAGAAAGAVAATAAVAQAARPTDPELRAIDDALRAAGPRLVAAARRSSKAVRAQATVKTVKGVRAKRAAARRALAAERREVLALRDRLKPLPETSADAHNVKVMASTSLTLAAQSLQKRERTIGAEPKVALRLLKESEKLFLRSLGSSAAAGKLLGRGS